MIEEDTGPEGVLVMRLLRAKDLVAADANGYSDPYCVVRLPGTRLKPWRSRTCKRTLNPSWDQTHEFAGYLSDLVAEPLDRMTSNHHTPNTGPTAHPQLTAPRTHAATRTHLHTTLATEQSTSRPPVLSLACSQRDSQRLRARP